MEKAVKIVGEKMEKWEFEYSRIYKELKNLMDEEAPIELIEKKVESLKKIDSKIVTLEVLFFDLRQKTE